MTGYTDFMLTPVTKFLGGFVPAEPEETAKVAEYASSSIPTYVLMGFDPEEEKWEFITAGNSVSWMLRRVRMILGTEIEWDGETFLVFGRS